MNRNLVNKLRSWLGPKGRQFFSELYQHHGERFGSVLLHDGGIPHPVHFREGMQVRNWLRDQKECRDWDADRFDSDWAKLVAEAIQPQKRSIFDLLKRKRTEET